MFLSSVQKRLRVRSQRKKNNSELFTGARNHGGENERTATCHRVQITFREDTQLSMVCNRKLFEADSPNDNLTDNEKKVHVVFLKNWSISLMSFNNLASFVFDVFEDNFKSTDCSLLSKSIPISI